MAAFTEKQIRSWRKGADGFFNWLSDIRPMIPSFRGGYEPFKPEQFQVDAIRQALACDEVGNFRYRTIVFSFPRRHSKTTLNALLVLWRFSTRITQNIICLATSEKQSLATGFKLVKQILTNTPALLNMIGVGNVKRFSLEYPALENTIRTVSNNVSTLYGEKISVAWTTELHAATSDEAMQVLASSLGDSLNSWLLVDSTVDATGGPLHRLEILAETGEDPTIYVKRLEYADLQEALEKSPRWIDRQFLKSREKTLIPATFATQHLNKRAAADNRLFSDADILACQDRIPLPVDKESLEVWAAGRNYQTGGGLDRAYGFSKHGDSTIWTAIAKVGGVDGQEPEYLILNQQKILASIGALIKKTIANDVKVYGLSNISFEAYNSQDLIAWAQENGIATDTVHATNTAQIPAFTELHRIVKEGRLHFSDKLDGLAREMSTFMYELVNGSPRFGNDKFHDDRVYSLVWAIYSLRNYELAAFKLPAIACENKTKISELCYLNQGESILNCSKYCPSHIQVNDMFLKYRRSNVDSEVTLPDFYKNMVKVSGIKIISHWGY